ncbi:hypothetical protein HPB49_004471 [Dermacentor silvarum]|uniref:Uncharacterized protein n=1 Tax=Dermacentor silvarum TaxID=543639 RepID=A0ACB8DUV9_DERSI|nr:hypothetical protein HPB49_004471 [Dermacentor silvarum]
MASQELQRGPASDTVAWSEIPATSVTDSPDSTPIKNEGLFKLVERRSRKRNANSKSPAATSADHSTLQNASARVSALHDGLPRKPGPVWKPKPLPRLHREDIVIILKPRVTVALKDVYQHGELGAAFAAYLGTQAAASLSLLPTWEQNLIVAGTRDPHVADKLLRDFQLDSSKGQLLMHGHLKLTGEVCRGVITVANHETSESLQNKIQWRAGELADIRKLGNSNVAALTFVGKVVPRFVHYNSEVTLVHAYKRTIPTYGRCGTVGHRADTCPCPDNDKCDLCGHTVPTADGVKAPHECTPSCAVCGQAHATNSRECTAEFRQLKLPGHKAKRHKRRTTRRPKKPPSHPTPEANGGAPRGAHGADPKTRSPPPLSVTSAHGKKTAPPPPPPSGKDTSHFPALKTDGAAGARASTPQHGKQVSSWARVVSSSPRPSSSPPTVSQLDAEYKKQIDVLLAQNELLLNKIQNLESKLAPAALSPQNSDAMESDAELSPALVATISAMEERHTSKLGSMIETSMDQILIKVMTAVPAMISKHIMDNPRLLRRLGPVKDVSRPSKFNCLINESENEDNCPAHSVITPLVAQRAGSGAAIPSSSPLQNSNHGETP